MGKDRRLVIGYWLDKGPCSGLGMVMSYVGTEKADELNQSCSNVASPNKTYQLLYIIIILDVLLFKIKRTPLFYLGYIKNHCDFYKLCCFGNNQMK